MPYRFLVDAILLDNDGVLVDSTPDVLRHWRMFAERHGLDVEAFLLTVHGRTSRETIAAALPGLSAGEVDAEHHAHEEMEAYDNQATTAVSGGHALVARLAGLPGARWAVVTSGTRPVVESRLAAAGYPMPPVLVPADEVARGKPDPEPYLTAARRLGVDPRRCLVVEDAPAGIAAGRGAGAHVLGLLTTHTAAELDGLADALAPDLRSVEVTQADDGAGLVVAVG